MTPSTFRLDLSGPTATLTLTTKKGSLPPAFWGECSGALRALPPETRALVIRGEDVFSAGLDTRATLPVIQETGDFWGMVRPMQRTFDELEALEIPTIAAVQSHCIGAGLELAAACDLRLCSADAQFSLPEVRLGLVADLGGLGRLPALIGRGRTAHLALTGLPVDAATAQSWGLVTAVLDTPDELYAQASALAHDLAGLPAHAVAGTKRVLRDALPLAEGLEQAGSFNAAALRSARG